MEKGRGRALVHRLARVGFWFFLAKGLLWIALSALALVAGRQLDWF